MMMTEFLTRKMDFNGLKTKIDRVLDENMPRNGVLSKAMRYCVFPGGKRIRPLLVMCTAEVFGETLEKSILPACAIELIHTFTLIHDDLPCMDNDDFRRGRRALHKVYGEAVAVLTGDALFNLSFDFMCRDFAPRGSLAPQTKIDIIGELTSALGHKGLAGGQAQEFMLRGQNLKPAELEDIYMKKTASLMEASVRIGAMIGEANAKEITLLSKYGRNIGLAFQMTDDIIEFTTGEAEEKNHEPNCVRTHNMDPAKEIVSRKICEAKSALDFFGNRTCSLRRIADYISTRCT